MTNALAKLDKATRMLAEAKTLDEVKLVIDISKAAVAYAKAAKLGVEAENHAKEIQLLAARKAGEFLSKLEKNKPGPHNKDMSDVGHNSEYTEAINEAEITRQDANRFKTLAEVQEEIVQEYIDETKAKGEKITFAGAEALATPIKRQKKENRKKANKQAHKKSSTNVSVIEGDMLVEVPKLGKFDLVIADPPYNVTDWHWDDLGTRDEFLQKTRQWLKIVKDALNDSYTLFWFCSPTFSADIEMEFRTLGLEIKSRIVWHRRNMAKGSHAKNKFVDSWEMVFHCGTRPLNFPDKWSEAWFDVQTFPVPQTNFKDEKLHPTQKPEKLIRRFVEFGSAPGERILDPFAGSGTTGRASKGRDCVLVELNPEYANLIREQFE